MKINRTLLNSLRFYWIYSILISSIHLMIFILDPPLTMKNLIITSIFILLSMSPIIVYLLKGHHDEEMSNSEIIVLLYSFPLVILTYSVLILLLVSEFQRVLYFFIFTSMIIGLGFFGSWLASQIIESEPK